MAYGYHSQCSDNVASREVTANRTPAVLCSSSLISDRMEKPISLQSSSVRPVLARLL
jgi:hypothetical protein